MARRDQAALGELYQRSARELAEEVVQDVFVGLWRSPDRFDPARGPLRPYLLAQSHGRAVDIVRSENARRRRETVDANAVKTQPTVEEDVLGFVVGEKVRHTVGSLCQTEREVISLAYFGGHSYVEVASLLGIPEGTAKSRIRSGLARLRTALDEGGLTAQWSADLPRGDGRGGWRGMGHPSTHA